MRKTPTCPLCGADMEKAERVRVEILGGFYAKAWVCSACRAAFPIAELPLKPAGRSAKKAK